MLLLQLLFVPQQYQYLQVLPSYNNDYDNDGIANRYDYDSDNDGRTSDEYDEVQFWINCTYIENEKLHLKQQFDMKGGGYSTKILLEGDISKGLHKINGTLIGGFK